MFSVCCVCGCVGVLQDVTAVTSSISTGHQSESDIQIHQQEVLTSLQQQVQQLCSDVDQLTVDMKHMSVTYTQVIFEIVGDLIRQLLVFSNWFDMNT